SPSVPERTGGPGPLAVAPGARPMRPRPSRAVPEAIVKIQAPPGGTGDAWRSASEGSTNLAAKALGDFDAERPGLAAGRDVEAHRLQPDDGREVLLAQQVTAPQRDLGIGVRQGQGDPTIEQAVGILR